MKKEDIQPILLAMLDKFTQICDEHQINYCLAYGTHLGAIRHDGFIPWDDDVDVFMLPEDLKKLRSLNLNDDLFFLQNKSTDENYCLIFDKVLLKGSRSQILDFDVLGDYDGIFIDIFPLYYVPNGFIKRIYMLTLLYLMKYMNLLIVLSAKKYQEQIVGKIAFVICRFFSIKKINKLVKAIQDKLLALPSSDLVTDIELKPLKMFKSAWFKNLELHLFAHKYFKICSHSDELLSLIYGDYMKLPPDAEKLGHEDITFTIDEETIRKLFEEVD
ncbi:MAG: LicD family protein [Erysipelotrichaceae bacterium]|nr:LicD family protein [Erysipelotrichaceae bacterium]MDY5252440.1 LicD family protein [Erysipelotrichaceae bacterium]